MIKAHVHFKLDFIECPNRDDIFSGNNHSIRSNGSNA